MIEPELNPPVRAGIWDEIFGVDRSCGIFIPSADDGTAGNRAPHTVGLLHFNDHLRFSFWQRHSDGKPNSVGGGADVLALNSVIARKDLTSPPGSDGTDSLAMLTQAPTRHVEYYLRAPPIDA